MIDEDLKQLMESMHAETRAALRQHFDEKSAETRGQIDALSERLDRTTAETRTELRQHFDEKSAETRTDMRRDLNEATAEMRRHFDVVAESLESKIDLLTEGFALHAARIDALDAKVERLEENVDDFRTEVKAEFFNVRATIERSHTELDRRVSRLETAKH